MRFKEFIQYEQQPKHPKARKYIHKMAVTAPADDMGEEEKNLIKTLEKIPKSHADLVRGYKWKFEAGNTLEGDDQHIGYIDDSQKEIVVAGPWNYGREFTVLHEIGHRVWEKLPEELKIRWKHIVKRTKNKQNQSAEELFCMAYANYYAKNKIVIHDHPTWKQFIKNLPETL